MVPLALPEPQAQIPAPVLEGLEAEATARPLTPRLNGLVKAAPQTPAEVQAQASSALAVTAVPASSSSPYRGLCNGPLR